MNKRGGHNQTANKKSRKSTLKAKRRKTEDQEAASNRTLAALCNLSVGQVSDFREIFRQIDLDNNGSIDENELHQLLTSINSDDDMCTPEFVRSLIARVKNLHESTNSPSKPGGPLDDTEQLEFTFEELMLSILKRPQVDYTKQDVLKAFSVIAGASEYRPGVINTKKLARAVQYGDGGISKFEAEELMTMLEHNANGAFDYVELCDLLMGHDDNPSFDKCDMAAETEVLLEKVRKEKAIEEHCQRSTMFTIPKHILEKNRGAVTNHSSGNNSGSSSACSSPSKGRRNVQFTTARVNTKKLKNNMRRTKKQKERGEIALPSL